MLALKPSLAGLQDKDGATPLMYASNKGHKEVGGGCGYAVPCRCDAVVVMVTGV